jgi:SAM-dependent methyltransferase
MPDEPTPYYKKHLLDGDRMETYLDYQERYAGKMRESDKLLIEHIRSRIPSTSAASALSVLDIGCSNGNFLRFLRSALPACRYTGIDISPLAIDACKKDPDLRGMDFLALDMLAMSDQGLSSFDITVCNASLPLFTEAEFDRALGQIGRCTKPGGWWIAFDWFHPFEQEIEILEKSRLFPHGLRFHFRSQGLVSHCAVAHGFRTPEYVPFHIPIDLPKPEFSDITSHTVRDAEGRRMSFRGSLFQPWCFTLAQKKP